MKPETKTEAVAIITLRHIADMHKRGRKAVAAYLRKIADHVEREGDAFSGRTVCRYHVPSKGS